MAGGESSRMKTAKANLPHPKGGTFLRHAVTQLQLCCEQIVCSVAAKEHLPEGFSLDWIPPEVTVVHDSVPRRGPAEGLYRSLLHAKTLDFDGCIALAVDMPMIQAEHLGKILNAATTCPAAITCAFDLDEQMLQPLLGFYPVTAIEIVGKLAASSRRSLYHMVRHTEHQCVSIPTPALLNVNRTEDWVT